MVKSGGTGRPALVISARPAPLPPSWSRIVASPSAWPAPPAEVERFAAWWARLSGLAVSFIGAGSSERVGPGCAGREVDVSQRLYRAPRRGPCQLPPRARDGLQHGVLDRRALVRPRDPALHVACPAP